LIVIGDTVDELRRFLEADGGEGAALRGEAVFKAPMALAVACNKLIAVHGVDM
jgi:hypothetical protein